MSRLDELKKQYPELNITIFDFMVRLDKSKTYKYLPLLCKLFGERFDLKKQTSNREDFHSSSLKVARRLESLGLSIEGFTKNQMYFIYQICDFYSDITFETFNEFTDYMEQGFLDNNDVTSYKNIDDMRGAVSMAVLKSLSKEMETQVIKEFEDDTWVAVRPLTFAASAKYGAATKWCTTYQREKNYFERYWRTGILVYFINKKTGYKFAGFRDLDNRELSFWNPQDMRVDYLDINIDDYMFSTVSKIFKSNDTNKNLCNAELQEQVHQECITEYEKLHAVVPNEPQIENRLEELWVPTLTEAPVYDDQPNVA